MTLLPSKVIITGTLHKQIFFVADDDLVRHMGEDIPFTTFVDLPGIEPGDSVTITPVVEHVGFELIGFAHDHDDSSCSDSSESDSDWSDSCDPYVEEPEAPCFRRLIQRTVILLIVRGSEEQAIRVATAPLPLSAAIPAVSC